MQDTDGLGQDAEQDRGCAAGGRDPGAGVLGREAHGVAAILAAWGEAAPVPVVAALADMPSAQACRHLEHLVRCGLAERVPYGYRIVAGAAGRVAPAVLDGCGWARVAQWCTPALFEAAGVLGAVDLPGDAPSWVEDRPEPDLPDRPAALDWYAASYTMLMRVLRQQFDDKRVEAVWRMALLMLMIDVSAGPGSAWREVADLGIAAARAAGNPAGEAMIGEYQGLLLLECGETDLARSVLEQVRGRRVGAGDQPGIARSDLALGLVQLGAGHLVKAELLFRKALDGARTVNSGELAAFAMLNLGATLARGTLPDEAEGLLNEALWAFQKVGRTREPYEADALRAQAGMHRRRGQLPHALTLAAEALEVATWAGLPLTLAAVLTELGTIQEAVGDTAAALASLREARAIYLTRGDTLRAGQLAQQITASRPSEA